MFQPINPDQSTKTVQVMLTYLDDPANSTPNNLVEGIASGKSLLRALLNGDLVICSRAATAPPREFPPSKVEEGPVGGEESE